MGDFASRAQRPVCCCIRVRLTPRCLPCKISWGPLKCGDFLIALSDLASAVTHPSLVKEDPMEVRWWTIVLGLLGFIVMVGAIEVTGAEPYELSKNDVMDPKNFKSMDISLIGVKLAD